MIKVEIYKITDSNDEFAESKIFENAISEWDKEVSDWIYNKVINYSNKYHFENANYGDEDFDIYIKDEKDNILSIESMVDYFYNL